jgi:hypothetical protein
MPLWLIPILQLALDLLASLPYITLVSSTMNPARQKTHPVPRLLRLPACALIFLLSALPLFAADGVPRIHHSPAQPRSGERVTITASLGTVSNPILQVQTVSPGSYIRKSDPAFESAWRDFPMEKHGDNFIASIPADLQKHRTLVRYRIKSSGPALYFPARTNAAPNFAYFVYDGFPGWKGKREPGGPVLTFSPEFLGTLPTYHLIANERDVRRSQWDRNANRHPFFGTLVYQGRVYDHIQFHNRGQASTYVAGKNKWGIKFNPGEEFNVGLMSNRGRPYAHPWSGLNLNPCASAWAPVNRGMAGMDEALSYRVYQLAGVPSPDSFWIQFRVIDAAEENPANQYNGDLWGLYLVLQEKNGAWLRENDLPDGTIFNPESGTKYQPAGGQDPMRPRLATRAARNGQTGEEGWRASLDLPAYYSFHAINRYVANIDLRPDGNHYLYYRPDGRCVVLPHDLDMMLIPKHHQPGYVMQSRCLEVPALRLEYQNRAREILDLLASDPAPNGGQIGQLVAELSRKLTPPGHSRNWAELDAAMWNYHPRSHHSGQFFVTPYSDHRMGGHWERTLATPDFAGFCKYILEFCTDTRRGKFRPNDGNQRGYGYEYLAYEARDAKIPERPSIQTQDHKKFTVSEFASGSGGKFGAIQWRISEISAPGLAGYRPGQLCRYEIEPGWSRELDSPARELELPPDATAPGRSYRIRARYQDHTGRCSHWSPPIQFVTGAK